MIQEKPLPHFLFENDPAQFFDDLQCPYTPWLDTCVLLHFARRYRPGRFLEIGTHRGSTTRALAERFPEMTIVTVDPGDQVPLHQRPGLQLPEFLPQAQIGELARDLANVRVVKQPFQEIVWGEQRFDMIFIDGNHFLPHVLDDSLLALRLLESPGVIVWHDFNHIGDVNQAVEQLPVADRVVALAGTWIAFYDSHGKGAVS